MSRLEKINQFLNDQKFMANAKPEVIEKFIKEKKYLEEQIPQTGRFLDMGGKIKLNIPEGVDIENVYYKLTPIKSGIQELSFFIK